MMDALGVIYAAGDEVELKEITRKRSAAAVPVGGRYRLIDFVLSNMVNSGIRNIGIITKNHYNSLMVHLGAGKEWDLNRKRDGLFIFPPYSGHEKPGWYKGSVDALHSIMGYIRRSSQKYVIISGSNMVCNLSFNDALRFHIDKGADITMFYKQDNKITREDLKRNVLVRINEDGRVYDMEIQPAISKTRKVSMKMYIIEKSLLEYLIEECVARGNSDFVKDILLEKINTLKIYGYPFEGYSASIDSMLSYYRHNMDLLDSDIRNELFYKCGRIYTRVMDEVPAKYSENAVVQNCIVADGCVVEGEIENSVLFRGVKVYKEAKIKNSIIMQGSEVQEGAVIENVIIDKQVIIRRGKRLTGQENYPVVIRKGAVI